MINRKLVKTLTIMPCRLWLPAILFSFNNYITNYV